MQQPQLNIVLERWWIRDSFCPADMSWRAVIVAPGLGITSAADSTAWRAIARAGAYLALKRCGAHEPSQAQEELGALIERTRRTVELLGSIVCLRQSRRPRRSSKAKGKGERAAAAARRLR